MAKKFEPKDLGIQSTPAGFNIPKIKKDKSKGELKYVQLSDRESTALIREVDHTCLDRDLKIRKQWSLKAVSMVSPAPVVETRYREKRAEMKEQGGSRLQQEVFGFYICRDKSLALEIARTGIKANPYVKGCLGDPSHGVYLFRYLDVALLSQRETKNANVLVFKVLQGRVKQIPVTEGSTRMVTKEPTPNFDCHISQSAPLSSESVFSMCSKSQMYVYEYTEDALPAECPRQCLPYALLEFSNSGDWRMDAGTSAIGPKSVSASAASAGWSSIRRPSSESTRKAGPAGQPMPPPTPPVLSSDADVFSSSTGKETQPSVVGGSVLNTDTGTWWAPMEVRDSVQSVAMELTSTADKPADQSEAVQPHHMKYLNSKDSNNMPLVGDSRAEHEVSASASNHFGQGSVPVSAAANRDPRLLRLSRSDRPNNPSGSDVPDGVGEYPPRPTAQKILTSVQTLFGQRKSMPEFGLPPPQAEPNRSNPFGLTWNTPGPQGDSFGFVSLIPSFGKESQSVVQPSSTLVSDSRHPQQDRNCGNYLLPGQGIESSSSFSSESAPIQDPEDNLNAKKAPHIPCLDRAPAKSALKKPTATWPSPQVEGSKKKKTLSYQDYLKKKKAEAQANPEVKETVKSPLDNNQQENVKCLTTKSSEELESLSKSVGFRKEEFQGCDFIPPEMSGQNEHSFKSGSTNLSNRTTDTVTNLVNSSEKLVPYPHSDSLAPNSKSVRRDPRLHSSYLSSASSQKVASHESNEDSEICKKLEGVAPERNVVADESEQDQATNSPQELPSDSLKCSSAAQDQSTDSKEQKDLDNHCTGENSVSKLLDIANHQVLFADIEETENENALRMFIDDVSPADCSPEGEDGAGSTSDQEQTNDEDPPTAVVRSAGDGDALVPGKDEAQDGVSVTGIKVEITDGHWSRLSAMQLSSVKEGPKSMEDTHFEKWQPSFISQNTTSVRQSCPSLLETEPTTEPAFREGVRVTHEQKDERLLSRLAKGLKEKLATLGDYKKSKDVSPSSGANEMKKTGIQTPNTDSFSRKKDNGSPSSESAVPASSPINDQKVSSEDAAFDCAEEARTRMGRKSACGKKHKTKGKQKGKKTCDCETGSNVDYAMLRLAKGLRPGKTIHVGGLGKNPTDDPLPVLEGKRRRKKNQEAKKDKVKTSQTGNEERHPQYQKVAKKPRKKRKGTLGPGRRRGRKKAAQMLASSGNEEEIDYTDFQFEEPQDFRVSISDSMEMVNSASYYPAAERVVKVEPGEEGFSFSGKTRQGTEGSDRWGPALPLSYLGLQHWTEALLLPSLNPQVALVDFFKACKGLADFDNCEICQKVIDQRLIEDDDQRSTAAEDTTTLDSGTTSLDGPENVFPQAETESELSELKERGLPGEACANEGRITSGDRTLNEESSSSLYDDVGLITKSVSQKDHNTKSESQAVMPVEHSKTNEETFKEFEGMDGSELLTPELEQTNIPRSSVKDTSLARSSSAVSELVIGTGNHSSNDHPSTQRIEEETPSELPAPHTDGITEMAREGTEACSQVEQKLKAISSSVGPAPLLCAKHSIVPSLPKLPSDTSSSPPSTQDNHCQKNIKTGGSPRSQSPFSFSTTRSARPRTTLSVCSQGSTKHCWQRWKFNQAQQMQLKTSSNMDNMRTTMSGIDSDEGQNIYVPQDQTDVTDNHENNVNRDHTDFPVSSSSDLSAPEDASGHLEKSENTSVKSVREKNVSCNSDSSASVQNRQNESYLESGYWLGINELTSLHQSQEDSVKLKDKTEIFSRSASKISPTKLSRLKPENEALQLHSTAPSWSPEVASGDLSHQTHVLTDDVGSPVNSEQTDEKMQGHVEKVAADSTQVTALSDVPLSTELANKNTGSSVSSKPINSCSNPYLTGLNRRDALQSCDKSSDSLNQSRKETTTLFVPSEDLHSISDNLPVTPGHSKKEAKCILSPSFSGVGEKPRGSAEQHGNGIVRSESYPMTASKIGEESRDDPLAHLHSQAELPATSKRILAEIEKSKSSTTVPQFSKGANAWLYQQQATCALPDGKSTYLFDSIIRDKGSLTRKHHSSIPGLDLLTSTDTEEATSTEPSVNVDSIRFGKGTPEELQGLNDDSQQCKEVCHSLESYGDEMGDITQNSAELKRSQQETLTGTALETVLETSAKAVHDKEYSRNATLNMNEELDIVGTPGISSQNKNRLGSKLKPLSLVCHSLERKKENTNKGGKGYLGDEKSDIDDLWSLEKGDSGKTVERNALESDDEKSNEGTELTGCPIPSFTRSRANQKVDRKDVKKQFDIVKGSGMDNSRNMYNKIVHSQSIIPAVQTSIYDQPPPPGVDVENSPQMTNFGQFYGNLPHSQFHYMPPVQQQPVVVNTIFAPRVSVPPPDVLSSSVHRSSVTDPTSICNSNPVLISEPDKSASSEGGQHMLFPPQMVPPVFTTLPPAPAPVPATCLPLPDSVTVSLVTSSTSQIFSASTNQVCVTAADSSHDSAAAAPPITSSSCGPAVRTDDMNRDLSVQKAEVDVISWFAKRMAAEKNPPKKDVMDWFSDIIDKKRSVSSLSDLEPELKKAKIDFMESVNQKKKTMCEPKEKVGDSSGQIDRKTTPCESRVVGKKNPVTLKRQTSSCSSEGVSGTKKPKNSISKVSFKVGLSCDGVLRKRGPLAKSVDLGSLSDSDELPDSTNETQQIPSDGKSRSDKQRYNETQQIPSDGKSRSDKQRYNETQQIPSDGKSRSDKQRYNETQQIPSDGKSRSDKQRYSETQQIPSDGKSRSDKQRYSDSETQQIPSDGKLRSDKQRYSETQQIPSDGKSRSDKQRYSETQQIPSDGKSRSDKQRYSDSETQQIPSDGKLRSDKQRYSETQQIPSDGKSRSDKQRYSETQQIPSDGKSRSDKQRYNETQQIPSDGKLRSDKQRYSETQQIPSDGKSRSDKQRYNETQQTPSDGKSRSDKQRSKNHSSEACGKIVMDIVKDTEKQDADIPDAHCANSGKEMRKSGDKNKDDLRAVKASSENRKRLHSRWDQKTSELKSSVPCNTDAQQNDSDDDMIDYAHALLEGDLKVKSLEPISNRISDSILKSTSTPKTSEADGEPSISQQSSDVPDKKPAGQKETKVGKSKSNLTDKPLEFLLFAKEMIMQKLQEEEENEPVTTAMCPSDADSVRNQENRLFDESDVELSQQKTSEKLGAKSDRVTSEKEENNKESGLEWEQPISQSHQVSEMISSATVFAKVKEEVNRSQGIGYRSSTCAEPEGKIATSYLTAAVSERKESNTCVAPETSTAESKSLPYALNAANIAAITEEEINKLKNIVCQLTSLPVTNPNDKPSAVNVLPTSAKKDDKVAPTFGGKEQKAESISSETKNPQGEKAKTQGNRHRRSNAAGRDWSLFLTTPRSTYRRLLTGASEKRNFYGDIIQPPVFMDESVQVQSVHTSTDFHGHSHFASKPLVQTEYGTSFENAAMARLAAPQKTSFQCFNHSVQIEPQTKPEMSNRTIPSDTESFTDDQAALMKFLLSKTCASKADNSVESKTFLGGSGGSLMQSDKLQSESALQTNSLRTKEQSELDATCSPAVRDVASAQQRVIESSATMQYAGASKDLSSAKTLESASSTSSALNPHSMTKLENVLQGKPEVKTLRDFLLENFPGEDTESLCKLLDYKLTADVNIMNSKMKKDIICRIRKHLENVHPVSTSSTIPTNETTPQTHLLLEEFAVDQIELELRLVEGCLRLLEATQAIQTVPDQGEASSDGQSLGDSVSSDSHAPVKDALSVVLQDFNGAMKDLDRVCRGRPHQRIPTELLLPDEQDRMYTKEGAFTILLSSIPSTAFQKLLQCKTDIEACLIKICRAATTNQTFLLQQEKLRIHQFRTQRLQMLRTFTGTVSANRLKKVTTIRDHYTTSQYHLHQVLGERSVAKMVFFSASLAAIQNHLQILEKEMK